MFNIGFGELVVVLLVAFLVVGPKDLPKLARNLAKGIKSIKRMIGDIKEEIAPMEEESYLKDLAESLSEAKKAVDENNPVKIVKKELASLDPLAEVKQEVNQVQKDISSLKKGLK